MRTLARWEKTPDHPWQLNRGSPLEEERREALESVIQAMATTEPDPDRTAACRYLLRHLALGSARGGGTARG
ncbi:MAG: hypothetical protein ABSG79_19505 [Bryobacteraceae bacterium]|jgi:hypothetical protein